MHAATLLAVCLLFCTLFTPTISTTTTSSTEWDIAPGVIAKLLKDKGHEGISKRALERLPEKDRDLLNYQHIKEGVRWNDMPSSSSDGARLGLFSFLYKFVVAEKSKNPRALMNAVAQSHVGCNQHWHGMAPVASIAPLSEKERAQLAVALTKHLPTMAAEFRSSLRKAYTDSVRVVGQESLQPSQDTSLLETSPEGLGPERTGMLHVVYTNEDVYTTVKNELVSWWTDAVALAIRSAKDASFEDISEFVLGHVAHTAQDSYAPAHTVRGREPGAVCGHVMLYDGYVGQHGNPNHGLADHNPDPTKGQANTERRKELQQCAEDATFKLFEAWAECKRAATTAKKMVPECRFPLSWFKDVFRVHPLHRFDVAGGTPGYYSQFYDEDPTAAAARLLADGTGKIQVRPLEVNHGGEDGKGKPFADCDREMPDKPGWCIMDIHELRYLLIDPVKDDPVAIDKAQVEPRLPLGIRFTHVLQATDLLANFCGTQQTEDEQIKAYEEIHTQRRNQKGVTGVMAAKWLGGKNWHSSEHAVEDSE